MMKGTVGNYKWTITSAFDNNHILTLKRKDGTQKQFWWGSVPPTEKDAKNLMKD
jgi:hypothetical protein